MDYTSSGLENPLAYLLFTLLFIKSLHPTPDRRQLLLSSFLAALILLCRQDFLLILAPVLTLLFLQSPLKPRTKLKYLLLGLSPLIAWQFFTLLYYGFPFPNTYYAKIPLSIPRGQLLQQGLFYFADSLKHDPVSLSTIALGLIVSFLCRSRLSAWAIGLTLYLLYILWVGGDFMSGRFFSVPFLVAVLLLAKGLPTVKWRVGLALILTALSFLNPYHPVLVGKDYYEDRAGDERELYPHGIVDERGMSYKARGLLNELETHNFRKQELEMFEKTEAIKHSDHGGWVEVQRAVGAYGYFSGPYAYIVDELGLTDPLLARLPARDLPYWRIGHSFRFIPANYTESRLNMQIDLVDEDLQQYREKLELITQGAVFNLQRLKTITAFNLGKYNYLIDNDRYRQSIYYINAKVYQPTNDLATDAITTTPPYTSVLIEFDSLSANSIEISLGGAYKYQIAFLQNNELLKEIEVSSIDTELKLYHLPAGCVYNQLQLQTYKRESELQIGFITH